MQDFKLNNDVFIIEDFDKKAPFCSFLPGLAGEKGIPLWSFYVNRGQCMTSFGIDNKDNPIMEFFPANVAYENTSVKGFRTFVKKDDEYFEPFFTAGLKHVKRTMYIKQNSFKIVESDSKNGLETTVEYFILPEESFGAIVREVTFKNLSDKANFEILDGMPRIIPYGVSGPDFTRMANLMRSYNTITNLENKIPLIYKNINGDDDDEVKSNEGAYYYLSFDKDGLIAPVYDPMALFDEETSLITPVNFIENGLDGVLSYKQHSTNRICGCFTPVKVTLDKGEEYKIHSLVGYTHSAEFINKKSKEIISNDYLADKLKIADKISYKLTNDIGTNSANKNMDMYFRQCYLDNFLRGGYPFTFKGDKVVHLFSRRHGDPERDYNFFSIAAEYYSQGDGNFRDVCQNRRNDVLFHPECKDFNIWMFFSLMQFDGYNPLFVKGTSFSVKDNCNDEVNKIIDEHVINNKEVVEKIVSKKFSAGSLINGINNNNVTLKCEDGEFLDKVLEFCDQNIEASTDRNGNWSDHWDYNLDLIENYLKIYPDKLEELLFQNNNYLYFESDMYIRPRSQKYVFNGKNVRQYNTFDIDTDKYNKGYKVDQTNWVKDKTGKVYKTNLFEKLVSLCVNKFALLDPEQMGIEMEAGRASWCDACNGLPSMIGSGMSETFELKRMLEFAINVCDKFSDLAVELPVELVELVLKIKDALASNLSEFDYWDTVANAREDLRAKTRYSIDGSLQSINVESLKCEFEKYLSVVEKGIKKAVEFGDGFCPTYIRYNAVKYDILEQLEGNSYPSVKVYEFKPDLLPKFLEGPAKYLRVAGDKELAEDIVNKVKASDVYDKKLKMYKTSESLSSESIELGRITAFTPGWQENESVFLHMEYKFIYAMLETGIYDTFFKELKNVFIPFLDPKMYGRSILENCSFLASSSNPDENLHGRGFVSRLSGSTTEVVSIWADMFLGKTPFVYENGKLGLRLQPVLPDWMFDENGEVTFNLLTDSKVILHNPKKASTYNGLRVSYIEIDNQKIIGDTVWGEKAEQIRSGEVKEVNIYFE